MCRAGQVFVVVVVDDVDVADDARHKGLHSVVDRWTERQGILPHCIELDGETEENSQAIRQLNDC